MKIFLVTIFLMLLSNCSFDNKTGIWDNANEIVKKDNKFRDFESLYTEKKSFNKIIEVSKDFNPVLNKIKSNLYWKDEFYNDSNNLDNFSYKNLNELIFKSKKISRYSVNKNLLFDGKNIIISDSRGNIIVYSIEEQKIIYKFNFYKKKIKKIEKKLNLVLENNIIYASDNIGYLYAINYIDRKILWAKNFKKPFRSNLKINQGSLVLADQDNILYIINKYDGTKKKTIPTEEVILKNDFFNSFALDMENLFYLNTFGSLYSINNESNSIEWFVNLNQSLDLNASSLFNSNPLTLHKKNIIISSDPYLYILNKNSGFVKIKTLINSVVKPVSSAQKIFLITKDSLLVCIDINTGKINFSIDINQKTSNFLNTKNKKSIKVKMLAIVNNNLFLFLKNSYLIKFNINGEILEINKLPAKLNSFPIFINNSILYLNNKNRLIILN